MIFSFLGALSELYSMCACTVSHPQKKKKEPEHSCRILQQFPDVREGSALHQSKLSSLAECISSRLLMALLLERLWTRAGFTMYQVVQCLFQSKSILHAVHKQSSKLAFIHTQKKDIGKRVGKKRQREKAERERAKEHSYRTRSLEGVQLAVFGKRTPSLGSSEESMLSYSSSLSSSVWDSASSCVFISHVLFRHQLPITPHIKASVPQCKHIC